MKLILTLEDVTKVLHKEYPGVEEFQIEGMVEAERPHAPFRTHGEYVAIKTFFKVGAFTNDKGLDQVHVTFEQLNYVLEKNQANQNLGIQFGQMATLLTACQSNNALWRVYADRVFTSYGYPEVE